MKKYISAILINALMIQFAGCYTQREITYDEFYHLPKSEDIVIETINGNTIYLLSDSLNQDYINWAKNTNTITMYPTRIEKDSLSKLFEIADTIRYSRIDISKIYLDEFDTSQTITGIAVLAVFLGIVAIIASTYTFRIY
jgi:hypothetical protein